MMHEKIGPYHLERKAVLSALSCLVAQHHWDEVSWAIAEQAWRFEPVLAEVT